MLLSSRFRLPIFTLLGANEEKERRLIAAAKATLGSIYAELALCLPESEVRQLFRKFANRKPGKRSNDELNRGLLAAMGVEGPRSSLSKLAKHLYQQDRRWGASADAIEKHLRRLRREQKRRRDASDADTLRWWKAMGSPTSLLNDSN